MSSSQPIDGHVLRKYFDRQEHLDRREAKLNRQEYQLSRDRLKSGAIVSKLNSKQGKLAQQRNKLATERQKANATLEAEAKKKPCKEKNCAYCPTGLFGDHGCVFPEHQARQDSYLANCENESLPSIGCTYVARDCSSIRNSLRRAGQRVLQLEGQQATACASGATQECNDVGQQLGQAQAEQTSLTQALWRCEQGP